MNLAETINAVPTIYITVIERDYPCTTISDSRGRTVMYQRSYEQSRTAMIGTCDKKTMSAIENAVMQRESIKLNVVTDITTGDGTTQPLNRECTIRIDSIFKTHASENGYSFVLSTTEMSVNI